MVGELELLVSFKGSTEQNNKLLFGTAFSLYMSY